MPYSQQFGDHFYCRTDGRQECGHVFLAGNGLPSRWTELASSGGDFTVGELGFGTGLNFCETWRQWKGSRAPGTRLRFISFELFPMQRQDIDRALSRWPEITAERTALVSAWPDKPAGRVTIAADDQTELTVVCGPALEGVTTADACFDAWFLDGFAPSRNPDMWSAELMGALFQTTRPGGTFATYAAAGFVRRNLAAAGFFLPDSLLLLAQWREKLIKYRKIQMSLKLNVIIGSTRPGRAGPAVAKWAAEHAKGHGKFDVELVDLASFNLPLLDEPHHPRLQQYQHEHTKRWSASVAPADAFLFVVPEYDYFPNAALVNALQALSVEWSFKAAGVLSYGGISGGLRSAQELRQLIGNLNMMAIPQTVPVPFFSNFIGDDHVFAPAEPVVNGLNGALDQLAKWAGALKTAR
eukprot:g7650.t1